MCFGVWLIKMTEESDQKSNRDVSSSRGLGQSWLEPLLWNTYTAGLLKLPTTTAFVKHDYKTPPQWNLLLISSTKPTMGIPVVAQQVINLTSVHEDAGSIPCVAYWVGDPVLLWLWCRPAAAAPVWSLAWELPYATGVALKSKKQNKTKNKKPKPSQNKTKP